MRCLVCKDLYPVDTYPAFFKKAVPVRKFQESSCAGCLSCGLVLDAAEAFKPGWVDRHCADGLVELRIVCNRLSGRLTLRDKPWEVDRFYIIKPQANPTGRRLEGSYLSSLDIVANTLSDDAFSLATTWLTGCLDSHTECTISDSTFVPRRLLDVGSSDGIQEPFLFESKKPCHYVALSYCWGNDVDDVLKLTNSNVQTFKSAIQFSSLPQTLRDAVTFCRGMKMRYLWVDSLCIVQGDDDDWLQESAQMRLIYSNSHLTIAAHKPASCKLGFLGNQKFGKDSWQRSFRTKWHGCGPEGKMFVRVLNLSDTKLNSSLEKRGWTAQEGILPTRVLHFTGNEMAWECNNRCVCECGHLESPSALPLLKSTFRGKDGPEFLNEPFREAWARVIQAYSSRRLKKNTDKLIAISGIAQTVNSSRKALHELETGSRPGVRLTYLAGMWLEGFPSLLLWQVKGRGGNFQHTRIYPTPTWSWASIDGPVEYREGILMRRFTSKENSYIIISEYQCDPESSSDPMGSVKGGYLVLTGLLAPVQLVTTKLSEPNPWGVRDGWRGLATYVRGEDLKSYQISSDLPGDVSLTRGDLAYECWTGGRCRLLRNKCAYCHFKKSEAHFYCLKVASYFDFPDKLLFYLVLKRSSTVQGAYERFGIGMSYSDSNDPVISFFDNAETVTIKLV